MKLFSYFYKLEENTEQIQICEQTTMNYLLTGLILGALFSCMINQLLVAVILTMLSVSMTLWKTFILSKQIKSNQLGTLVHIDGSKYSLKEPKVYYFERR